MILIIMSSNISEVPDDMDTGISDTDDTFDHNIGLSSPHASDVEDQLHSPSSPRPSSGDPDLDPDSPFVTPSCDSVYECSGIKSSGDVNGVVPQIRATEEYCGNVGPVKNLGEELKKTAAVCRTLSNRSNGSIAATLDLSQLQNLVCEMKEGFVTAMHTLAEIQYGDQVLEEKVDNNKVQYDNQLADVLHMVVSLKSELGTVLGQLQAATSGHRTLQVQVETLQYERDVLLQELEKAGAITSQVREKYHSGINNLAKFSSHHSTSLTTLLERGTNNTQGPQNHHLQNLHQQPLSNNNSINTSHHHQDPHQPDGSTNSIHITSDHDSGVNSGVPGDSCDDSQTTASVSPIVQSYIANLSQTPATVPEEDGRSECSITAAANHSLDLSRSLIDELDDYGVENVNNDAEGQEVNGEKEIIQEETVDSSNVHKNSPDEPVVPDFKTTETPKKVAPHERSAKEFNRLRVARELLDTEKKYCSCLWTLLDHFAGQLKERAILSMSDISEMFPPCLARMYDHHCALLEALEQRLTNCKYQCVLGDILFRFIQDSQCELLNQYQKYMKVFPHAMQAIKETARTNSNFRNFLKDSQKDPCCEGLDVGAFLLTPIQRIPRYVLILKQMLRHTEVDHPDHYYIETSLHHLGSFLTQLNNSIQHSLQEVNNYKAKPKRRFSILPTFRQNSSSSVNAASQNESMHPVNSSVSMVTTHRPSQETIYGYESFAGGDGITLVQDGTGRLVPVKPKKYKGRRSKRDTANNRANGDRSNSLTHSASFHSSHSESNYGTEVSYVNGGGNVPQQRQGYHRTNSGADDVFSDSSFYSASQMNSAVDQNQHPSSRMQQQRKFSNPKLRYFYTGNNENLRQCYPRPPPEFATETSTPNLYGLKSHSAVHFGVYGENDSDVDADISSSTNPASMHSPRYYHHVGIPVHTRHHQKFKSQSCVDMTGGGISNTDHSGNLAQEEINMALARSLSFKENESQQMQGQGEDERTPTQENLPASWGAGASRREESNLKNIGRTKSELLSSTSEQDWTMVHSPADSPNLSVTNSYTMKNGSMIQGVSRKDVKRKQMNSKSFHSQSTTDLNESSIRKKPSLKQSIKNIFLRKRNNKVTRQNSAIHKLSHHKQRVPFVQNGVAIVRPGGVDNGVNCHLNYSLNYPNGKGFIKEPQQRSLNMSSVQYSQEQQHNPIHRQTSGLNATLPPHLECIRTNNRNQSHHSIERIQEQGQGLNVFDDDDENEEPISAV